MTQAATRITTLPGTSERGEGGEREEERRGEWNVHVKLVVLVLIFLLLFYS